MFGFVMPRMEEISPVERQRYQAFYCGVCRALGNRHTQLSRLALTYDMTFLALLLGSLYEPTEQQGSKRCIPHPAKPHLFLSSECIEYAADMSVVLVYHKCLDDWSDEGSVRARTFSRLMTKPYAQVSQRYPQVCVAVEEGLAAIGELERAAKTGHPDKAPSPDAAANLFGALLGEVFAYRSDFWADGLRLMGAKLGKLVYVMDAALDMDSDRASGSYNPLVALNAPESDVREDLQLLAAEAAAAFEKLPLERDAHLLRSVLYAGIWQQYYRKEEKKDKEARRG